MGFLSASILRHGKLLLEPMKSEKRSRNDVIRCYFQFATVESFEMSKHFPNNRRKRNWKSK